MIQLRGMLRTTNLSPPGKTLMVGSVRALLNFSDATSNDCPRPNPTVKPTRQMRAFIAWQGMALPH
jgi:hypothetical protein